MTVWPWRAPSACLLLGLAGCSGALSGHGSPENAGGLAATGAGAQGGAAAAGEGGGSGKGGASGSSGVSGSGGVAGALNLERLGASCTEDADCGGLHCFTEDGAEFGGQGFPGGLCSVDCEADESVCGEAGLCRAVGGATGRRLCVERCSIEGREGLEHTTICRGRWDVGCLALSCDGVEERDHYGCTRRALESNALDGVCLPACNELSHCPGGACDLRTGLCGSTPRSGQQNGAPCDPRAPTDPCAGHCIQAGDEAGNGFCTSPCVIDRGSGSCMTSRTYPERKDLVCEGHATGGMGVCTPTCDCGSSLCPTGAFCFRVESGTERYPYADTCVDARATHLEACP